MTTSRQIRALYAPLLERNPDLVLIDRVLLVRPIRHVARGVMIERTSSADLFRPQTASTSLLTFNEWFPLGTGHWIYRDPKGGGPLWLWSDPSMPEDFVRRVEEEALPQLRVIQTLEDYLEYSKSIHENHFPHFWGLRLAFCLALGRLDEAQCILNDPRWGEKAISLLNTNVAGLGDRLQARGPEISRRDRASLARMLHQWEARSVEKLKLSAVWERTPFPIELEN